MLVLFPVSSVLQLNLAMFLQLQGLVLYTYFKPFEEGVRTFWRSAPSSRSSSRSTLPF